MLWGQIPTWGHLGSQGSKGHFHQNCSNLSILNSLTIILKHMHELETPTCVVGSKINLRSLGILQKRAGFVSFQRHTVLVFIAIQLIMFGSRSGILYYPGGGTDLERGYGDVRPWRPFSRLSCSSQGSHFKQKSQFTSPPFEKKNEILASVALIFAKILAHKPPSWKFSAHKPPNSEIFSSQAPNLEIFSSQAPLFRGKYQFASPKLRNSRPHTPTWKS